MARLHRGEDALLRRVLAECRAAIEQDGIQSIVLGCTCMAPIAAQLAAALNFPLMEGSSLAVRAAREQLADRSAAAYQQSSPPSTGKSSLARGLVDAYLGQGDELPDTNKTRNNRPDSACEVCVP